MLHGRLQGKEWLVNMPASYAIPKKPEGWPGSPDWYYEAPATSQELQLQRDRFASMTDYTLYVLYRANMRREFNPYSELVYTRARRIWWAGVKRRLYQRIFA